MRFRRIGAVLLFLALLWLLYTLLRLDPLRTGLAALLLYGGYRLVRGAHGGSLTGAVHLMDREYHLQHIDLSALIADVKIDLSRAIMPAGEQPITIRGLVGTVDIYVPYDLAVSVDARVRWGKLNLISDTAGYAEAESKVKIAVSLAVGDVNVRYL